ncbi:MAG: lipopolysaccharide heptosyltransferase II [Verrucomicrobiota bacterium]
MEPKDSRRILIRSPNWLGDAVMAVPALQSWQQHARNDQTFAVVAPANLQTFWQHIPGMDAVFVADRNPAITVANIAPWKADTSFILPNSPRTALEACLAGIPCRIGFTGKWRKYLLTHTFDRPSQTGLPHHQSLDPLDLLKHFHLIPEDTRLPAPEIPAPNHTKMVQGDYLLICPGAEYGAAKRWPADRYAHLADTLGARHGLHVVLSGGDNDREVCRNIAEQLTVPHTNTTGRTSLREFLSLCAHARLILCNDSGAMHTASLFRTPGVALFGSTEPRWTGPISDSIAVLQEDVPCSPCFLRECPIDFRCMNQLSEERVLEACQTKLNH